MAYFCTKTYDHSNGWSCAFRQWKADSHCKSLHGYALSFKFVFHSETLDERNWVMSFGGLSDIKAWLISEFDHTTIISKDDPYLEKFQELDDLGIIDLITLPTVGCEAFTKHVFDYTSEWLSIKNPKVQLVSVEVREHGGNSAIYLNDKFHSFNLG